MKNVKHKQLQYESGRSMVETIGVLAVMGVLTIGGIAGYNYGINKHRTNQVLQDIRLIYLETKYPNTVRQIVETGSFPDMELDTQSSYEYLFTFPSLDDFNYDSTSETTPNLISVNVSGVSKTACDILLKTKPEYVLMLKANGQSVWSCDKSENELSYIFEITTDSLEYGTCSVCTGEHCFDDDLNCPEGEYCYNDTCSKCAREYTLQTNDDGTEECVKCTTNYNAKITKENCYRCKGTLWGYRLHSGAANQCVQCGTGMIATTKEFCEEHCGHIEGMAHMNGYCLSCTNFGYLTGVTREACEQCMAVNDNIIFYPKDANGTSTTGLCTKCNTKNADGTACVCPAGNFWIFGDGNHSFCRQCSEISSTYTSKIECDKCPNRYYATSNNDINGECKLCPSNQVKSTDGRSCVDSTEQNILLSSPPKNA